MPGVPFARGERVALHTVERDDVSFLQRGRNHPEVRGPLGLSDPTNATQVEETVEEWVENDDGVNLLVCLPPDDGEDEVSERPEGEDDSADAEPIPIGTVNVIDLHLTRPEVAYWLLPDHQGEGYATEAMTLLLDYFFDTHEKRGVEAHVFGHNDASQALLERLGFVREGTLRDNRFVAGEYRDTYVYGLLREEWTGDDE